MTTVLTIFIIAIVYLLSIEGTRQYCVYEKEKMTRSETIIILVPIFNTIATLFYIGIRIIDTLTNSINEDIDREIKKDFTKKLSKTNPTAIPTDYARQAEIETTLEKNFNIPTEAWQLILEWEKLSYNQGRYEGNLFPDKTKMNNPLLCKQFANDIKESAEKITSGNAAHNKTQIVYLANRILENITEK